MQKDIGAMIGNPVNGLNLASQDTFPKPHGTFQAAHHIAKIAGVVLLDDGAF